MSAWFLLFLSGMTLVVPLHFKSVEHQKLEEKYGQEKGTRIGGMLGMISGWGFFGFWIGVWFSPQPQFTLPLLQNMMFIIPLVGLLVLSVPLIHLVVALIFLIPGAWLGIAGVKEMGLEATEKHRSETVVSTGLYSRVRHPQYLGAILSHLGITFLISGLLSLLSTPLIIILNYLLCWKEEEELVREFGDEYRHYQEHVPMIIPKLRLKKTRMS